MRTEIGAVPMDDPVPVLHHLGYLWNLASRRRARLGRIPSRMEAARPDPGTRSSRQNDRRRLLLEPASNATPSSTGCRNLRASRLDVT